MESVHQKVTFDFKRRGPLDAAHELIRNRYSCELCRRQLRVGITLGLIRIVDSEGSVRFVPAHWFCLVQHVLWLSHWPGAKKGGWRGRAAQA